MITKKIRDKLKLRQLLTNIKLDCTNCKFYTRTGRNDCPGKDCDPITNKEISFIERIICEKYE